MISARVFMQENAIESNSKRCKLRANASTASIHSFPTMGINCDECNTTPLLNASFSMPITPGVDGVVDVDVDVELLAKIESLDGGRISIIL